jgi:hypothetical protein
MSEWGPIATAPFDEDVEVGIAGRQGIDALALLCRRTERGWVVAPTGEPVPIKPTHWRPPAPFVLGFDSRAAASPPATAASTTAQ